MNRRRARPAAIALVLGLLQAWLLRWCWMWIAAYSPLPAWLLHGLGLRGAPFYATQWSLDLLLTVVLCLPCAWLLCRLRPRALRLYVPLALLPGACLFNTFATPVPIDFLGAANLLQPLLGLPLATLLVRRLSRRGPTRGLPARAPLRGTA